MKPIVSTSSWEAAAVSFKFESSAYIRALKLVLKLSCSNVQHFNVGKLGFYSTIKLTKRKIKSGPRFKPCGTPNLVYIFLVWVFFPVFIFFVMW